MIVKAASLGVIVPFQRRCLKSQNVRFDLTVDFGIGKRAACHRCS